MAYNGGDYEVWKALAREKLRELLGMEKYICPCGYREKASNFHNKQKSGGKVSRQDMKKYMNNNTSAEVSPFELALKKAEKK